MRDLAAQQKREIAEALLDLPGSQRTARVRGASADGGEPLELCHWAVMRLERQAEEAGASGANSCVKPYARWNMSNVPRQKRNPGKVQKPQGRRHRIEGSTWKPAGNRAEEGHRAASAHVGRTVRRARIIYLVFFLSANICGPPAGQVSRNANGGTTAVDREGRWTWDAATQTASTTCRLLATTDY